MRDKRLSILLVEDNPGDARLIQEMLRGNSDDELSSVDNLSAALDHLGKHSSDIILLDLGLPDSQGLATVTNVASRMPTLPIIVLTGLGDDMIALDALKAGAQDYLMKGFVEPEMLMRAIRYAIERKLVEVELRKSEERYRVTLEGMVDAVSIQALKDTRYLYVNKAFCDITGFAPEEIIGKKPLDLNLPLTPEDQSNYLTCILEARRERQEIQYRMKDGTILYVLLSCTPVHYQGEDSAVVVMTDITALKQSEQNKKRLEIQLAQAHKMEALGTLAGGIAHDFNNLLTAITGYTEIAKLNISEPDKMQKSLNDVIRSCKRAKELVAQILTFSRHAEAKYALVNLSYVIQESLSMLRSMFPANIEIRQNLTTHRKIMADPSQINQVIMNLAVNAIQAMEGNGGLLDVSLEGVGIDAAAGYFLDLTPGPYLKLTVSDTGHGMTLDVVDRIFEPYFTTKRRGSGAGMGLSIVHGILKRHGGAITCKSTPGAGTVFEIYLPEAAVKEEAVEPPVEMGILTGTERILFVDDEQNLTEVAQSLLESLGYKVTATTSSNEALEFFLKAPDRFDLVVTDMTMPEMMGDKLAQRMMEIRPDIPIILYTGYSEHITEKRAKSIGIREFILKPFEIKDMARIIRTVLDKK